MLNGLKSLKTCKTRIIGRFVAKLVRKKYIYGMCVASICGQVSPRPRVVVTKLFIYRLFELNTEKNCNLYFFELPRYYWDVHGHPNTPTDHLCKIWSMPCNSFWPRSLPCNFFWDEKHALQIVLAEMPAVRWIAIYTLQQIHKL